MTTQTLPSHSAVPRSLRSLLLVLAVLVCLAAPAASQAFTIGMSDQKVGMWQDPRFAQLGITQVRLLMAYDNVLRKDFSRYDAWMSAAHRRGADVLVTIDRDIGSFKRMPSLRQYRKVIRILRERYPWVDTYGAWNEANHVKQPTYRKPKRAAMVYDLIKTKCRSCTVTAPSLLDAGIKTVQYAKAFNKAAKKRVTIWALHNHIDANRNRLGKKSTTNLFLRNTRGQVWFTETGGIWNRWVPKKSGKKKHIKQYNRKNAVRAIRNIFKLARLNKRRVTRIYYYNWYAPAEKKPRWDSGLIGPDGKERTTYRTLRAQARKYAR
jgi:hypothetical protein